MRFRPLASRTGQSQPLDQARQCRFDELTVARMTCWIPQCILRYLNWEESGMPSSATLIPIARFARRSSTRSILSGATPKFCASFFLAFPFCLTPPPNSSVKSHCKAMPQSLSGFALSIKQHCEFKGRFVCE